MATDTSHQGSSSSSSSKPWIYDVYLSFSRSDIGSRFSDHLSTALQEAGINVFVDNIEQDWGKEKVTKLLRAIEGSKISVIVISRNYAASRRCLEELVKIMECRRGLSQLVMPIFYDVVPSDFRELNGGFAEAFTKHEARALDMDRVKRWRDALTEAGKLAGWEFTAHGFEGKFIREIIDDISGWLSKRKSSKLSITGLCEVGINSRVLDMSQCLGVGLDDVRIVGIWGTGGVGKTTLAKAIYNLFYHNFEGASFLASVRETIQNPDGQVRLQKQFFYDILRKPKIKIGSVDEGINVIKERLGHRRVLVIIDDIDQDGQLYLFSKNCVRFGSGSRIIITTRDKYLLQRLQVNSVHLVREMNVQESLELFSWHAFGNNHPNEGYYGLSISVVAYCGGLPLALEVLGCTLSGKSVAVWESTLKKLERIPDDARIEGCIRISIDGLSEEEKNMFLDIACFYSGMDRNQVTQKLNASYSSAETVISGLLRRCLVTVSEQNELLMHDMVRDIGKEVFLKNKMMPDMVQDIDGEVIHANKPLKRSRLMWFLEDGADTLTDKSGTQTDEILPESSKIAGSYSAGTTDKDLNLNFSLGSNVNIEQVRKRTRMQEEDLPESQEVAESYMDENPNLSLWVEPKLNLETVQKLTRTQEEDLPQVLQVADSYSTGTLDKDLALCLGSDVYLERAQKCTRTQEEDAKEIFYAYLEEKAGNTVKVTDEEDESLPEHLKVLFLYCSLFPSGYEFRKDELVQLWIAEGFIGENQGERMEDTSSAYFNSLKDKGYFVRSRCDFRGDFDSLFSVPIDDPSNFLYKVNHIKLSVPKNTISQGHYFIAVHGTLDGASEMTQHLSLICDDIDEMIFGVLKTFKHLRTLRLLSGCGSSIKQVPANLFLSLKFLRTLNLSQSSISELPSSIRNVKTLRYLDVSNTPITRLPESIDCLHNLQTIKLRGCIHFFQLPKGMKKLINLRHIELDIIRQLDSMPAYLGNLTKLQTLSAFLVGRNDGYRIGELKNLNDLKGALRILRLENVLSEEEAEEAALINKKFLHRLDLRWSNMLAKNTKEQEKILLCLKPHYGLKELQIQNYGGSMFPTWISSPSFVDLVVITLYRCKNCALLPSIGQLPELKFLSIIEMNEVKEISHQFFRSGPVDDEPVIPAFPKLERLELDIMLNLKEWKAINIGDLPLLIQLTLNRCPELVTLPSLSCLKSLKHLEFRRCPKLLSLPSDGLLTSLESFIIIDCPELKKRCRKGEGEDWSKICHVPSVWFDHEHVTMQGKKTV